MKKFFAKCFQSRKFTLGLSTILIIILNDGLNLGLSEETIANVIKVAVGTITTLMGVDIAEAIVNKKK